MSNIDLDIPKEDVEAYEKVRRSGKTNMFDVRTVSALSGLNRITVVGIMNNYSELMEKYGIKRR